MESTTLVKTLCSFVIYNLVLIHAKSDDETSIGVLNLNHVIIGPPENLTKLFTGQTNVVLRWDPPHVYHVHDVNGYKATVTKINGQFAAFNASNEKETDSSENHEALEVTPIKDSSTLTDVSSKKPSSSPWKCQGLDNFSNYTVHVDDDLNTDDGNSVVAFKDSKEMKNPKTENITCQLKDCKRQIVKFEEGCIKDFHVLWKEEHGSGRGTVTLGSGSVTQVNITGLRAGVGYKVSVRAYFVSGDVFDSKNIIFNTMGAGQNKTCMCDKLGSHGPCNADKEPPYCKCNDGYEGDFCTKCSPGNYRTAPNSPCQTCPCNGHSNLKTTCSLREGFVQCDKCETGYHGNTCHLCEKGYNKQGIKCVPCFCNGHTPSDAEKMCSLTGECMNCQQNTTGFNCERCLPNYKRSPDSGNDMPCVLASDINETLDQVATEKPGSSLAPEVLAGVIVSSLIVVCVVVVLLVLLKRKRGKRANWKFWAVSMKKDRDDMAITAVHNNEAHMDDMDEVKFNEDERKQTAEYARLREDA